MPLLQKVLESRSTLVNLLSGDTERFMLKSHQLVGAGLLIGSISCVVSCGDPSAVEPELVYAVESSFEATSIRDSDLYEDLHQLIIVW